MKGFDSTYVVALVFTLILGLGSFMILYSDFQKEKSLRSAMEFLGIPGDFYGRIVSGESLTGSLHLVSIIDEDGIKGFLIENSGDLPLTGFQVYIDNSYYKPYAAPSLMLAGSRAALLIEESAWQRLVEKGKVTISTKQNIRLDILRALINP